MFHLNEKSCILCWQNVLGGESLSGTSVITKLDCSFVADQDVHSVYTSASFSRLFYMSVAGAIKGMDNMWPAPLLSCLWRCFVGALTIRSQVPALRRLAGDNLQSVVIQVGFLSCDQVYEAGQFQMSPFGI